MSNVLRECCEEYGFEAVPLPRGAIHELGKTYWCSYWQTWYTVLYVDGSTVTCHWEDGHTNTHCTSLAQSDKELRMVKPNRVDHHAYKRYYRENLESMQRRRFKTPATITKHPAIEEDEFLF
ncbi:MAG TPA: hypothetical protein VN608_08640 [Clostridia bacterium]|nr:hypothetical protein [Clostridia bacterium]